MPNFNTTAMWALRALRGNNPGTDVDAGFQALAEDLDPKLTPLTSTTAATRPAANKPRLHHASDTDAISVSNGAKWIDLFPLPVTSLPSSGLYVGKRVLLNVSGVFCDLLYDPDPNPNYPWRNLSGDAWTSYAGPNGDIASSNGIRNFVNDGGVAGAATNTAAFTAPRAGIYTADVHAGFVSAIAAGNLPPEPFAAEIGVGSVPGTSPAATPSNATFARWMSVGSYVRDTNGNIIGDYHGSLAWTNDLTVASGDVLSVYYQVTAQLPNGSPATGRFGRKRFSVRPARIA